MGGAQSSGHRVQVVQVSYHEALAKVVSDESPPWRGGGGFWLNN